VSQSHAEKLECLDSFELNADHRSHLSTSGAIGTTR
jgi:hypothetical protein